MGNLKFSIESPRQSLTATTTANIGLSLTAQAAQVWSLPEMTGRIFGRWNALSCTDQLFDFFLDPGDAVQSPDGCSVSLVSLWSDENQTYGTDFVVKGW